MKKITYYILTALCLFTPRLVLAAFDINRSYVSQYTWFRSCDPNAPASSPNACTANEANNAVNAIWQRSLNVLYLIIGSLAVIYLVVAGIQYITAGGNPEKAKKAHQRLINVFLGVLLLAISYVLIDVAWGIAAYLGRAIS